jgi:hypothetical protein
MSTIFLDFGTITKGNDKWLDSFVRFMDAECAPCKYLGEISSGLGIDVSWNDDRSSVSISSERKIGELLERHDLADVKPRPTPIVPNSKLPQDMAGTRLGSSQKAIYQSIVGSLLYIMRIARPDLQYAVWYLACGMSEPTEEMWLQAINCLRYLRGTRSVKLTYTTGGAPGDDFLDLSDAGYVANVPVAFSDSDWAPDRSVSSSVVMFNGAALLWRSKRQQTTALSSVEAELSALTSCGQDIMYVRDVCEWLRMPLRAPTTLFCDNRGAIENAKHPCYSDRLRHVNNKIFFIREVISNGIAAVKWIAGTTNPADLGTKTVGALLHKMYGSFLMGAILPFGASAKYSRMIQNLRSANSR